MRRLSGENAKANIVNGAAKSCWTLQESTSKILIAPFSYCSISYATANNRPSLENWTPLGVPVFSVTVRVRSPERPDQTRTTWSVQIAAIRFPEGETDMASTEAPAGKLIVFSCRADCADNVIGKQQRSDMLAIFGRIRAARCTAQIEP